jgi:hypothetical protein
MTKRTRRTYRTVTGSMKRIPMPKKTAVALAERTCGYPCGLLLVMGLLPWSVCVTRATGLDLAGIAVISHVQSAEMRYRRDPDPGLGARVQLFLKNGSEQPISWPSSVPVRFGSNTADELLRDGAWAWHDTPSAWPSNVLILKPGALTVWTFNSKGTNWGVGTRADITIERPGQPPPQLPFRVDEPSVWLSAVTFLSKQAAIFPNTLVFHVANQSPSSVRLVSCRLWLPESNATWRELIPQRAFTQFETFPATGVIPANDHGGARIDTGTLPLSYGAVEVQIADSEGKTAALWAHLRIKREIFDISGGWVASRLGGSNTLHCEAYLKTLRRMHVNAGMHDQVPGYTDNPGLYDKYPLKYMNRCQPFELYDQDATLARIHAVEFLGEPQFGGGHPVPPMDVWRALAPYQATRMPTSVTHSEERIWRYYAGLSDFPHYDAYRVCAPAPDAWSRYDRWEGKTIRWGAPLETIGDMTRSLRDLSRPAAIAYWSQGAHDGWDRYGGRQRTSPTPDELRAQAYHALACRITSLYWFNLSLKSLVKFRDLIDPITRVNREILLMENLLLEGDAFEYRRELRAGKPDWDLASVTGPAGGLFFANDLAYMPDMQRKVFEFHPRDGAFRFRLPSYLSSPVEVFRLDADGVHDVRHSIESGRLEIQDRVHVAGIYVVTSRHGLRQQILAKLSRLLQDEKDCDFDPARREDDYGLLKRLLP